MLTVYPRRHSHTFTGTALATHQHPITITTGAVTNTVGADGTVRFNAATGKTLSAPVDGASAGTPEGTISSEKA